MLDRPRSVLAHSSLVVAALAAATVGSHLPGLLHGDRPVNPDEAFIVTEGRVVAAGGKLYVDVVDRKPPLVPLFASALDRVAGSHALTALRVSSVVGLVVAALLVFAIGQDRKGPKCGVAAMALFVATIVGFGLTDAQAASFESFTVPLTVLAVFLAGRRRWLLAGAAVALSALTLQVGAIVALPVAVAAWRSGRWRLLGRVAAGSSIVLVAAVAAFGTPMLFWTLGASGGYVDPAGSWPLIAHAAEAATITFALGAAVPLIAIATGDVDRDDADLVVWAIGALAGAVASLHFFGHYFLMVDAPIALLAGAVLATRSTSVRALAMSAAVAVSAAFVMAAAISNPVLLNRDGGLAAVIDSHSAPGDTMLVWGQMPELYEAAHRAPATRFLAAGFLTGYSANRVIGTTGSVVSGAWSELETDLTAHAPDLVVDVTPAGALGADRYAPLRQLLAQSYRRIARVTGADIYLRRAPTG